MSSLGQFLRFGFVGTLATFVHIGCVIGLSISSTLSPVLINTLAFLIAFFVSAVGHAFFTFRITENRVEATVKFFIVAVSALVVSNLVLVFLLNFTAVNFAKFAAISVAPIVSFFAAKFWAFKRR